MSLFPGLLGNSPGLKIMSGLGLELLSADTSTTSASLWLGSVVILIYSSSLAWLGVGSIEVITVDKISVFLANFFTLLTSYENYIDR